MSQRIVPFIGYEDAAAAIEWLGRAFGFTEDRSARYEEDGTITHAELSLDGATVYVSTPAGYASPLRIRESSPLARRAYDNPWVIDGLFVPLGRGAVDIAGVIAELEGDGYRGWYVLEQDVSLPGEPPEGSGPKADAVDSVAYLRGLDGGSA